jgi:hypothetical protein
MKITKVEKKKTRDGRNFLLVNEELCAWEESLPAWGKLVLEAEVDIQYTTSGKYKTITEIDGWEVPKRKYEKPKSDMDKAMEYKRVSIQEAQKSKEQSIMLAGAARDATIIITTFYPELAEKKTKDKLIKEKWLEWRKWLYKQSDNPFGDVPFI